MMLHWDVFAKMQAWHPAYPSDDAVKTYFRDSFPASDKPSWTATTRTGEPQGGDHG